MRTDWTSRFRFSTRIVLLVVAAACMLVAALVVARREHVAFAAKCWTNGNRLTSCVCVYNALGELPDNYRALAVSWAHDSGTAFAAGVMWLVAAESWRVTSARIERLASIGDKREAIEYWVWKTADAIGWMALKHAAPTVAASLAPVAAALPIIDDAAAEYNKAEEVVGRHCWTRKTFVGKIYDTRRAAAAKLEALTTAALDAAKAAGQATSVRSVATTVRVWTWVRSWF